MLQPGQQIENYRIDSILGEGGMGTIYRATDVNLMRPVAVKVMHGNIAADPTFQARFLQAVSYTHLDVYKRQMQPHIVSGLVLVCQPKQSGNTLRVGQRICSSHGVTCLTGTNLIFATGIVRWIMQIRLLMTDINTLRQSVRT